MNERQPSDDPRGAQPQYAAGQPRRSNNRRQGLFETALKAFIRSIGASLGTMIARMLTGRRR